MKNRLSVVAIALSTLVAGHALAADPSAAKTREQVRAELAEARRTGDLIADSETGLRLNQLYPHLYPQATVAAVGKTRAEVKAELAEARRNGDLIADSESGLRFNQLYPEQYAVTRVAAQGGEAVAQGKTRAQVKAELAQAIRNGDLIADSETGLRYNQLYPNRYPQPTLAQGQSRDDVRAELVKSGAVTVN